MIKFKVGDKVIPDYCCVREGKIPKGTVTACYPELNLVGVDFEIIMSGQTVMQHKLIREEYLYLLNEKQQTGEQL